MNRRIILIALMVFITSCASTETKEDIPQASAHYQLGVSYLNENKIQLAYVEFRKALELSPGDKEIYNALGLIHLKLEDFQKAREAFLKAIKIEPAYPEAHNNLGITYLKMGKWADAAVSFKVALKNPLYKTAENAYYNLGYASYRLGHIDEAITYYKEAIKRLYNFSKPYYGLALCYNAKGQYGDASTAITRAIALDSIYQGNKEKAKSDFENMKLISRSEEERKDYADYIEILNY